MLRRKSNILMAALFLTAGFIAGCSDDDDNSGNNNIAGNTGGNNGGNSQTIAQIIQSDDDLSIFKDAVERAGLMDQLNSNAHNYTVLAPTNEAFRSKYPTDEALDEFLNDSAEAVARYHIVPYSEIRANELANRSPMFPLLDHTEIVAQAVPQETEEDDEGEEQQPEKVRFNYESESNATEIVEPNIQASNGLIQKINKVLNIRDIN